MAQRVVLSSKQEEEEEEESVLEECCKSSLKSRTSLFEKATKPKDTESDRQLGEIASIVLHKTE